MTTRRAPFAALDDMLTQATHLLLGFDGPICSLFAGTTTASIADQLRALLTREGVHLSPAIKNTGNWFEIFTFSAAHNVIHLLDQGGPVTVTFREASLAGLPGVLG